MSGALAGALSLPLLLGLLALRVPVALAIFTTGAIGYVLLSGWLPLVAWLKTAPYYQFSSYSLSVVPMFLLMGQLALRAGLSEALFRAARAWLGHRRGGLAMATIGACAGFGAICGSSLATAATMSQVALPEMRRYRYSGGLATASLAAGGTLGILVPPSVVLVIYALVTEQNIARLFVAAVVPGVLAALGYMLAVAVVVRRDPAAGPAGERVSWRTRLATLAEIWPVAGIFGLVIGGIYAGWFTPTEGAAVGAFATGLLAFGRGGMRLAGLVESMKATAQASAMIFLILLGAELFNAFLALTRLPDAAGAALAGSGLPPMLVLLALLLLYLLLGCVMDSLSMILLTMPVFFPVVMALDFGLPPEDTAIWFGILALVVVEVGLITPPVGMNVFVINQAARDVPMRETFRGVLPFLAADAVRVALMLVFPGISLALVHWLG